jgi:hypothetical protein
MSPALLRIHPKVTPVTVHSRISRSWTLADCNSRLATGNSQPHLKVIWSSHPIAPISAPADCRWSFGLLIDHTRVLLHSSIFISSNAVAPIPIQSFLGVGCHTHSGLQSGERVLWLLSTSPPQNDCRNERLFGFADGVLRGSCVTRNVGNSYW